MNLGIILETNDSERVWNAFRLANTALDADHTVEVFLLGDGVEAPDLDHEKFNPHGVMLKYTQNGGRSSLVERVSIPAASKQTSSGIVRRWTTASESSRTLRRYLPSANWA